MCWCVCKGWEERRGGERREVVRDVWECSVRVVCLLCIEKCSVVWGLCVCRAASRRVVQCSVICRVCCVVCLCVKFSVCVNLCHF